MIKWLKSLTKKALFQFYARLHRWLHRLGVLPVSRDFGWGRGTPIGRFYIDAFLRKHADIVRGRCLEFGDPRYKSLFSCADQYEVVSITSGPGVDYVCDIHDCGRMPQDAFDAIVCTQVFEHLMWPEKAAQSLFKLMKPKALLLITAPFINQIHLLPHDYRRFTPNGLEIILKQAGFIVEEVSFGGNALVSTGALMGMVVEDFTTRELNLKDATYPYTVLIRARRPG